MLTQDREFAINVVCLFVNFGIIVASIFDVVADFTFLDAR
jgi:hypothetical protein